MTIPETPSYAALQAKKAELTTSQGSAGVQAPATIALARELAVLVKTCAHEAGIGFAI